MIDGSLHLIVTSSATNAPELFRVNGKGVLAVLLQHGKRLLVVDLPHPVRVARNPDFWKCDELASSLTGFIDECDSLLNAGLEIEPAGFGGDSGGLVLAEGHFGEAVIFGARVYMLKVISRVDVPGVMNVLTTKATLIYYTEDFSTLEATGATKSKRQRARCFVIEQSALQEVSLSSVCNMSPHARHSDRI